MAVDTPDAGAAAFAAAAAAAASIVAAEIAADADGTDLSCAKKRRMSRRSWSAVVEVDMTAVVVAVAATDVDVVSPWRSID